MQHENISSFKFFQAIPPQIVDADVTGATVDLQGYESVTFLVNLGALSSITSASYWVIRMQHASASAAGVDGTWSDVDASQVLTTSASFAGTLTSGIVFSIWSDTGFESATFCVAYRGARQYARLMIEEKANLSTAAIGAVAVLGHANYWPVNALG